ncbi:helix-hairpin-helix domain-containing protein [Microbacter sp. ANSKLAB05]|nr:helix-hairpin-helix domain-containing protein [Microbacter sp. ANSKLAB05]
MTGPPLPLPRLSAPATRALATAGITDLRHLDGTPEKDVLALHGVGPSQLGVLREALTAAGLAFSAPVSRPAATGRNDNTALLPTGAPPRQWIEGLPTARRVDDGLRLLAMFDEITGEPASMWAGSIVGYGHSHYVYDSGREGDTFVVGFSPRSSATSLYGLLGGPDEEEQLARLGPHKSGKGCLYVTRLDRIDARALRDMVESAWGRRAAGAGAP